MSLIIIFINILNLMNIKKKKIIFMSNGIFGIPTLKYLIKKKFNICYVITSKKNIINNKKNYIKFISKKKKKKLIYSEYIDNKNIIKKLNNINPDILLLISFKIIKKEIWKIPKYCSINIHPSLLPQYKGSCPINWVIINNEKITGLTSFIIDDKIDEGKIILQKKIKIKKNIKYKKLYKLLSNKTKKFTIKTIKNIIFKKKKKIYINNNKTIKLAPKINNYYSKIDFNKNIKNIYNKIRGLSIQKPAWCYLNTKKKILLINIYKIKIIKIKHNYNYGKIFFINKKVLITAKNGYINLLNFQILNKKKNKNIEIYNNLINKKDLFLF
ncbi:MAG: hypothetical protein NHG12_00875 [Candidatus Shikimatogenerans bostrichidophilus]|nr:MAG: hypothetical protein NHG12_00875 [Candidatus Shikimatogenerans bostrichidophilus]